MNNYNYNSNRVGGTAKSYHKFACDMCEKSLKEAGYAIKKTEEGYYIAGGHVIKAIGHVSKNSKRPVVIVDYMDTTLKKFNTYFSINPENHDERMFIERAGVNTLMRAAKESDLCSSADINEFDNQNFVGVKIPISSIREKGLIINI